MLEFIHHALNNGDFVKIEYREATDDVWPFQLFVYWNDKLEACRVFKTSEIGINTFIVLATNIAKTDRPQAVWAAMEAVGLKEVQEAKE